MTTEFNHPPVATSSDNTVLALDPPRVLGATQPIVGAQIGVSLVIYDLVNDGLGATAEVDPPLAGTADRGDVITLRLQGETTSLDSEIIVDPDAKTTLRIPKGRLHPDRVNVLFYEITRGSDNRGTSDPLTLLYNKIRPGLKDIKPEVDGHSELALLLPDAIKNGVGADFVSAQVCVSYPYCRAYDTITLKCNGEIMTYKVDQNEAPQPPNPGSPNPITVCFTVTRAYLDSAVRPSGKLDFSYTVTDQLGNTPDTDAVWSASQTVDEDLAGTRLPAPILREIQNDPTDDPGIIDLEKLGNNPLLLIVLTSDPRFAPGDTISATYTAKITGQPDVVVTVAGNVETDEFGQKKPCVLPVANDKVVAGSTVAVTYQLLKNGTPAGTSRVATAWVIGEGQPDLEAPRLQKSTNGELDPLDPANLPGANGQVEVLGYLKSDTVQLIVEGAPGAGSPTFTPLPLNTNSRANFPLDKAFIAANMGKTVKLSYLLFRDGKPLPPSPVLIATVGKIPDGHPSLPTPAIDRATGNELDVTQLQPSDLLRVSEWPHQVAGQNVWLRYEGFAANGAATSFEDRKGEPHDTLPGLSRPAPIAWLKTLRSGTDLTIFLGLNLDGVPNYQHATACPKKSYTIKANLPLEISGLTASPHSNPYVFAVSSGFPQTGFNGARFTINVNKGSPPYTFSSSSAVNSIDPNTGVVTIRDRNRTTFTVRDSSGATTAFTMQSLPLFFSVPANRYHNYANASGGGRLPNIAQMTAATASNPSQYIRAVGTLFGEWGNLMAGYGWPEGGVGAGQHHPDVNHYWTSQPAPYQGDFYIVSPKSGSVGVFWRDWQVPCTYII
ncbi:hypothetical protein [Pseudomonas sp. GL-B-19]|uniref:hypothetical protein n=1 Tax=Pseudomonas sp. GL-B-19 TaxID=2832393 RepID=UPI001CBD56FD|nr:hypothetical protein [Pseudomonas sp. GL-B-19]